MRELPTKVLVEYVDEHTPEEAPPFEHVERAVQARRRRRNVLATAAAVVVVAGAVVATVDLPRAEQEPAGPETTLTTPPPNYLDDGPPPAQFKIGTTLMVLKEEIPISSADVDPLSPTELILEVPRDPTLAEACVPTTVVRILSQDASTARVAAYRYSVGPDQNEGRQCVTPHDTPTVVHLDLRAAVGDRTIYAGSTGHRTLLN